MNKKLEKTLIEALPEVAMLNTGVRMSKQLVEGIMHQLNGVVQIQALQFYSLARTVIDPNFDELQYDQDLRACALQVDNRARELLKEVLRAAIRAEQDYELRLVCPYDFERSFAGTQDIFDHELWGNIIGLENTILMRTLQTASNYGLTVEKLKLTELQDFSPKRRPRSDLSEGMGRQNIDPDLQTTGGLGLIVYHGVPWKLLTPFGSIRLTELGDDFGFEAGVREEIMSQIESACRLREVTLTLTTDLPIEAYAVDVIFTQGKNHTLRELDFRVPHEMHSAETVEKAWRYHQELATERARRDYEAAMIVEED